MKDVVCTAIKISHNTDQNTARYLCQQVFNNLHTFC